MQKRQIINIISFIRGCEPRCEVDLVTPVAKQIELIDSHKLSATLLVQYDAMIKPEFQELLLPLTSDDRKSRYEIGVWFELNRPVCERAGVNWRGEWDWDWRSDKGQSVGYTPDERKKLVDATFEDFKAIFGFYPRSMGAWAPDAVSLGYAAEKYGLDAACNCKEQWGTDGYNLWGGYYGQAYYPNRGNAIAPAQKPENQIDVPVFRMLGSDPVYQYDFGLSDDGIGCQGVVTLEPVYTGNGGGGGIPEWVDWYMAANFSGECLSFGYAQAGQENSFGWGKMGGGLVYQYALFEKLQKEGKITVETLGGSGRFYKNAYKTTPASTITAHDDWKRTGRGSVWYSCKNYRADLYSEDKRFWIRDLQLFRDGYRERYMEDRCDSHTLTYDNLPVIDGSRFSGRGIRAGLYPQTPDGEDLTFERMNYEEKDGNAVVAYTKTQCGDVVFTLSETTLSIRAEKPFMLAAKYSEFAKNWLESVKTVSDKRVDLVYNGFGYSAELEKGRLGEKLVCRSEDDEISLRLG